MSQVFIAFWDSFFSALHSYLKHQHPLDFERLLGEEALSEGVDLVVDQLALRVLAGLDGAGHGLAVKLGRHELDDLLAVDRAVLLDEAHLHQHAGVELLEGRKITGSQILTNRL